MESSIWKTIIRFIKDSFKDRITETFGGSLMGFGISQHLLFSGAMADLVTSAWWIIKGIGSLVIVFLSSMLTSYGAYLVKKWTEPKNNNTQRKNKKKAA